MTSVLPELVKYVALFGVLYSYIHFRHKRKSAIEGSYERYKATTLSIVLAALIAIFLSALAIVNAYRGEYLPSFLQVFIAYSYFKDAWNLYHDDDNWFNGQFKRFKRGLKQLRKRRSRMPGNTGPLPSPI